MNDSTREIPWIVSVDDHVVEPPDLFERWLPTKFQAERPRVERHRVSLDGPTTAIVGNDAAFWDDDGPWGDVWHFGKSLYVYRQFVVLRGDGAVSADMRTNDPVTYDDMRRANYDPVARLRDMDINHVQASLCFPQFPRFCGQAFSEQTQHDRELGLACVRAYNDWMVDEWCGDSGGRLIPLCVIPLWDPELAAAEVRRNAARGVRAVTFSEIPYHLGLPSIHTGYWDPFFAACNETGTVINMHIGSSSKMMGTSPDAPNTVTLALTFSNSYASMADFLFSGVLGRFPELVLAYSEGQIGWIPYLLERVDQAWASHPWARSNDLTDLPSNYFRRHIYGCFFDDKHGIKSLDEIGVDNVTFETDYPHADSSFPHTEALVRETMRDVDDSTMHKILRGNAIRMLGLDLPEQPTSAHFAVA